MSLVRLPNGNWLDAWVITGVRVQPNDRPRGGAVAAVVVDQLSGFHIFHNVATLVEAEKMRNEFADAVNAAREKFPADTGAKP